MSVSEVSICNLALSKLGASSISSLTEDTPEAIVCNGVYEHLRDAVLFDHPWDFSLVRAELAQEATALAWDYSFTYSLPTDPYCLRIVETQGDASNGWVVEGRKVHTNMESVKVKYIARITDTSQFNAMFVNSLATMIASDIAIPLTGDAKTSADMLNKYLYLLEQAKGASSQGSFDYKSEDIGARDLLNPR